jgi:uncharacterized secreted protein with C-terminal beta-propeller domain
MRTRQTRRPGAVTALILALSIVTVSCAEFDAGDTRYLAAYRSFSSCTDLESWTRETLIERVTAWGFGGPVVLVGKMDRMAVSVVDNAEASTGTNVQETGVDEGDIAENDGQYVYAAVGTRLRAADTQANRVVADIELPSGNHQMVLVSDGPGTGRLFVATDVWDGTGQETIVNRYLLEGGEPRLLDTHHLEGALVQTRATGGRIHFVVRHSFTARLPFVTPRLGDPEHERDALEANRRVVRELTADDVLPRAYRVDGDGSRTPMRAALGCETIGTPGTYSGHGLTWVASLPTTGSDGTLRGGAGIVADAEHVYASAGALYVAAVQYPEYGGTTTPTRPEQVRTSVHRFDLAETVTYVASGSVPGRIISQYSLGEHTGLLRIATTTDDAGFGEELQSGVRVLERRGDQLTEIGSVTGLGLNERIHGVRFAGDLAFVVTFRQIDPLYVVDLADPTNPRRRGELKIPGFSTWLLPLGDGRLLAFGQAGTDDGNITGAQWSLFDVSDLDRPRLLDTLDVGQGSDAVRDPKALAYEPSTGLLLVPATTWTGDVCCIEPAPRPATDPGVAEPVTGLPEARNGYHVSIGTLEAGTLTEEGRVALPSGGLRAMLVGGRVVSVNGDGSFTLIDRDTLDVLSQIR